MICEICKKKITLGSKSGLCKSCCRKGKLEAHHIKSWKNYPKLRYRISNGKTLCYKCHHKRGYKII